MQRMGGGKQTGGGNDPTCGCDMQAGWPSASALPRGGLQGGGTLNNINGFRLNLMKKNGKVVHFNGKRKGNNNTNNNNNTKKNKNTNSRPSTVNIRNNTMIENENENENVSETKTEIVTSAPSSKSGLKKIVHKGKLYFLSNTKNVYERSNTGTKGKMVGKLVRTSKGTTIKRSTNTNRNTNRNTKRNTNRNMNESTPPAPNSENNSENENMSEEYDLEAMPGTNTNVPQTLSQDGGKRRKTRKHLRRK